MPLTCVVECLACPRNLGSHDDICYRSDCQTHFLLVRENTSGSGHGSSSVDILSAARDLGLDLFGSGDVGLRKQKRGKWRKRGREGCSVLSW